jgi:hypothetical protein
MDLGFLAVSILSGERSQIAPLLLGDGTALDIPGVCPEIASGVQVTVSPGGAPQVFDLERSYRNFLLYLIAKLGPDYIALMVEANLFTEFCPGRADAFYALYRSLYDSVRAAVGPDPMLFATLSYLHLLAYDPIACFGGQNFVSCKSGRPPAPTPISSEACYPTDRSAIDALEQGDRLDLLALSFYPDALEMKPPGANGRLPGGRHGDTRGVPRLRDVAGHDGSLRRTRPTGLDRSGRDRGDLCPLLHQHPVVRGSEIRPPHRLGAGLFLGPGGLAGAPAGLVA